MSSCVTFFKVTDKTSIETQCYLHGAVLPTVITYKAHTDNGTTKTLTRSHGRVTW